MSRSSNYIDLVPPEIIREILLEAGDSDIEAVALDFAGELFPPTRHPRTWRLLSDSEANKTHRRKLKSPAQMFSLVCSKWRTIVVQTACLWITTMHGHLSNCEQDEAKVLQWRGMLEESLGSDIDVFLVFMPVEGDQGFDNLTVLTAIQDLVADLILPYSEQFRQVMMTYSHRPPIVQGVIERLINSTSLTRLMTLKLDAPIDRLIEWPTKNPVYLPRLIALTIGETGFRYFSGANLQAPNLRSVHVWASMRDCPALSGWLSPLRLHNLKLKEIHPWDGRGIARSTLQNAMTPVTHVTALEIRSTEHLGLTILMNGGFTCLMELHLGCVVLRALCITANKGLEFPTIHQLVLEMPPDCCGSLEVQDVIFPNVLTLHMHNADFNSAPHFFAITNLINKGKLRHLKLGFEHYCPPAPRGTGGQTLLFPLLESLELVNADRQPFQLFRKLVLFPTLKCLSLTGPVTKDADTLNSTWNGKSGAGWKHIERLSITLDGAVQEPSLSFLCVLSQLTSLEIIMLNRETQAQIRNAREMNHLVPDWKTPKAMANLRHLQSLRLEVRGRSCLSFLEAFLSCMRHFKLTVPRLDISAPRKPKGFDNWFRTSIQDLRFSIVDPRPIGDERIILM